MFRLGQLGEMFINTCVLGWESTLKESGLTVGVKVQILIYMRLIVLPISFIILGISVNLKK